MICKIHGRSVPSQYLWLVDADRVPTEDNNCGAKTDDSDGLDGLDVSDVSL